MKERRALIACVVIAALAASCAVDRDPLGGELRASVEELKVEIARQPTTPENLPHRLDVFWEWANAYALDGGVLPVNLTTDVAYLRIAMTDGGSASPAQLAAFDRYVHELALKDERPDALGSLRFTSTEPLPAGSWQTFEQEWTVGSQPMESGGVILVARQLVSDQGPLQHEDPGADNYVSIRSSNPEARFLPTRVPWTGMHGGFRGAMALPAFQLDGTVLRPGDTVTVTYGDRSGGSRGFAIQTWSTDRLLLPLYLDLDGGGNFMTPVWPELEVIGVEAAGVRAVAPSVVAPGEPFELSVRTEDRFSNRATGEIPGYEVLLDGEPFRTIEPGGEAVTTLVDVALDASGVHRFAVRSGDGAIGAVSNPVWVREDPPHRVLWGETHGHTDFAEGQGSPEHYFRWGREDARLDFLTLSEHDNWMDDAEWRTLQKLARTHTENGRLVAFLGYEWTVSRSRGGHHNVLFRTPDRERVGIHRASLLPELYRLLAAENSPDDVVVIPHAHNAGDWTQSDPDLERLVELYSMHGTFEFFANFYLRNGFRVGFVAAADDHRARPGYAVGLPLAPLAQLSGLAAVLAPEKTPDAIFDAMRNLSAYATSGQRILLDATLNGVPMGTRQPDADRRELRCRVMGTAPITHIDVIKNGEVVFGRRYLTANLEDRAQLLVGFESSSRVYPPPRDNPRGFRIWEGTLEVAGARVVGVSTPGFDNRYLDRAATDPSNPNLIRFHVETRGRRETMLLELDGASPDTVLAIQLEPSREYGLSGGTIHRPTDFPAGSLELRLDGLVDGRVEAELGDGPHTDRVTAEVIDPEGALDMEFEFTDLEDPRSGDYYYVRVTQLDGGQAWSSPFWVGTKQ